MTTFEINYHNQENKGNTCINTNDYNSTGKHCRLS